MSAVKVTQPTLSDGCSGANDVAHRFGGVSFAARYRWSVSTVIVSEVARPYAEDLEP